MIMRFCSSWLIFFFSWMTFTFIFSHKDGQTQCCPQQRAQEMLGTGIVE